MSAVPRQIAEWLGAGRGGVLVRVVDSGGSVPRELGATMVVGDDATIVGSISAGCLESGVVELARTLLATDRPGWRIEALGTGADPVFDPGIACGGTMQVLLHTIEAVHRDALERFFSSWDAGERCLLATRLVDDGTSHVLAVAASGETSGSLGAAARDAAIVDSRAEILASAGTFVRASATDAATYLQVPACRRRIVIVGADEFAAALCRFAHVAGFDVTVVDPRAAFATRQRFPEADTVVVAWPDRHIESIAGGLGPGDAVCVLTHDQRVDVAAIMAARAAGVGYVGAMGSRATHADRLVRLELAGMDRDEAGELHSPIGLDIGASTPDETAVAIIAELVAARAGRSGAPLSRTSGPIGAARAPSECATT